MGGIIAGKRVLITGVLTEGSIAFHAAKVAQEEGAEVLLTGYGRMSLVRRTADQLPKPAPVIELDVTDPEQLAGLAEQVRDHFGPDAPLDGVVHSVAFGPPGVFNLMEASWEEVSTAVQVSAYSLKSLAGACLPLMPQGGSVVGITFDSQVTWPSYAWMGVAKSALESTNRYLARELGPRGVRCNLVASGPLTSIAARFIPGFRDLAEPWDTSRAVLGWDTGDPDPVGRGVVGLLSDFYPKTTGSVIHVDAGVHAMGG
ncbi:enoyl-ACP reductase FabI [Streptomyces sp. NPDC005438]|uniref:enoyl-ACP reductase FabI n=1 Tax=Streptomyces sp. NPDC005438 TaxID=3156880 RepID=UPI0033A6BB87